MVAAGAFHSLAVNGDGTAVVWGCGAMPWGQCTVPSGLTGVVAVSGGHYHSLALKSNGTVVAWGCGLIGHAGECNVPASLSHVEAIAAGYAHSLALVPTLPTVTSFTPSAAWIGSTITISGQHLLGATDVRFNGVSAGTPVVVSSTQVKAIVPAGASTGQIQVTTASGTGTSTLPFKVKPRITGFTPSARVGEPVTITGTGLKSVLLTVKFGAVVDVTAVSNLAGTQIDAHVPRPR